MSAVTSKIAISIRIACAVACLLALGAPPALADTSVEKRLAKGRALFGELEYRKTVRELDPVRTDQRATRAQRLEALELIGLSHLILGQEARAKEAFEDLLAIDPGHQLRHDDGSPKIREFYAAIRKEYVPGFDDDAVVDLQHAAPSGATAGRKLEVEVEAKKGAYQAKEVILFWRRQGVLAFDKVGMRELEPGRWRAKFSLPGATTRYRIEYYLEARGVAGGSVGRVGGPEVPLAMDVSAGAGRTPWYRRWYVIAGGAAALGIGTAALIFASSGDDAPDGTLEPGRITLSP
jgi:hypothetical protein